MPSCPAPFREAFAALFLFLLQGAWRTQRCTLYQGRQGGSSFCRVPNEETNTTACERETDGEGKTQERRRQEDDDEMILRLTTGRKHSFTAQGRKRRRVRESERGRERGVWTPKCLCPVVYEAIKRKGLRRDEKKTLLFLSRSFLFFLWLTRLGQLLQYRKQETLGL